MVKLLKNYFSLKTESRKQNSVFSQKYWLSSYQQYLLKSHLILNYPKSSGSITAEVCDKNNNEICEDNFKLYGL